MSGPTTRSRKRALRSGKLREYVETSPGSGSYNLLTSEDWPDVPETQNTVSEGHPWTTRKRTFKGDIGGDFFTRRHYVETEMNVSQENHFKRSTKNGVFDYKNVAPLYPVSPWWSQPNQSKYPAPHSSSNDALDELGTTAIARCKPTNSPADASVFLGELIKDGIPSLLGSSFAKEKTRSALGKSANEYLNTQFGWMPIARDVEKFLDASRRADEVLAQYERDSGKIVRRRYRFPLRRSKSETVLGESLNPFGVGPYFATYAQTTGRVLLTQEIIQSQWFSGAFTYHLPSGYDSRIKMHKDALKAKQVFGLKLTPEVLWEVAPWSWAIDWFSNTGDVVSNISDFGIQGLIMQYGYMMEHTIVRNTYTYEPNSVTKTKLLVPPLTYVTETKLRRRANPFGFGVSWDGLSPFQLSIAAALGFSRGSK